MSKNIVRDYKVIGKLGQGGMGQVWLAEHLHLKKKFALKMLTPKLRQDPAFGQRFNQEARMQAALNHPNIVRVTDFFIEKGHYFMVSEYIEGPSLERLISQQGPFSPKKAIYIIKGILDALNHAHQKGVIHRDVKPGNILINRENQILVTDFGLATMAGPKGFQGDSRIIGSPHHMSPEQIRNPAVMDHRVDVYAAGVIFFEMLTGKLPFDGPTVKAVWDLHLQQPAPNPRELNPSLDQGLADIVTRSLEKDPDHRYMGCGEFKIHIDEYEQSQDPLRNVAAKGASSNKKNQERPVQTPQTPKKPVKKIHPKPEARPKSATRTNLQSGVQKWQLQSEKLNLPFILDFLRGKTPRHFLIYGLVTAITGIFCTWIVNKNRFLWGLPLAPSGIMKIFVEGIPQKATFSLDVMVYSLVTFLLAFGLAGVRQHLDSTQVFLGTIANLFVAIIFSIFYFFLVLPSTVQVFIYMDLIEVYISNTGYSAQFMPTGLVSTLTWYFFLAAEVALAFLANNKLATILKNGFPMAIKKTT